MLAELRSPFNKSVSSFGAENWWQGDRCSGRKIGNSPPGSLRLSGAQRPSPLWKSQCMAVYRWTRHRRNAGGIAQLYRRHPARLACAGLTLTCSNVRAAHVFDRRQHRNRCHHPLLRWSATRSRCFAGSERPFLNNATRSSPRQAEYRSQPDKRREGGASQRVDDRPARPARRFTGNRSRHDLNCNVRRRSAITGNRRPVLRPDVPRPKLCP